MTLALFFFRVRVRQLASLAPLSVRASFDRLVQASNITETARAARFSMRNNWAISTQSQTDRRTAALARRTNDRYLR